MGSQTVSKVIETVRIERPHEYLKVVASILPKQVQVSENAFDGVSDEELAALIKAARTALQETIEDSDGGDSDSGDSSRKADLH